MMPYLELNARKNVLRALWRVAGLVLIAAACGAQALAAPAELDRGLVGFWCFFGCDDQTVRDLSAKGNDGTIEYGELKQEKGGAALELDGLDTGVTIRETAPFGLTQAVSTAFWVRAEELRDNTVLFGIPNTTDSWTTPVFGMYGDDGRVVYGMWGLSKGKGSGAGKVLVESPGPLPLRAWTFLASTYDGKAARLYINGELAAEKPAAGAIGYNGKPLLIGKGLGNNKPPLKGRVGELRVYSRALGAEEVRALFEATKSAYDLAAPAAKHFNDKTVTVESHSSSPKSEKPWVANPTRLLEGLEGYTPAGGTMKLDPYGGWMDRPREKATGFFYTKKIDGRHWLIDPEGYRFYHVAINTVREPRNVEAGFGSADRWAESVTTLLRENGFNGLGNAQSERLEKVKRPLVWVQRCNFMFAFAREKKLTEAASGTQGFKNRCMPVFHPDFEPFCMEYGKSLAQTAKDPTLLGIMTDNEIQCPVDLLDRYLKLDAGNPDEKPNRDAAAAWLAARQGTAEAGQITNRDRYEFIAYAFERYYQAVTKAIRKYDPNHLYLGSRINYHQGEFDNPWFWKMLAKYHDVVSCNYYHQWAPDKAQLSDWEAWSGLPILLTEWYAKAMDVPGLANTNGAGWLVKTQEDRARFYQNFTLGALETPNIVGYHWFKYADDPKESKALDAAGGANKGMFDLDGKPYPVLLESARTINREVYPLIEFFDKRNR